MSETSTRIPIDSNGSTTTRQCTFCDAPRARHDMCNRCRQKVESRARRLLQQKMLGDMDIINQVFNFIGKKIDIKLLNSLQYHTLISNIYPLLVS